jgi:hypothetical protein
MGLFGRSSSPREKFAQEVLDAVVATRQVESVRYDEAEFAIVYRRRGEDAESGQIFLHNIFRETADLGRRERAQRIKNLVAIVVGSRSAADTWNEAGPKLRPVVRGVSFGLGVPGATTVDSPIRLVSRPALPYLVELAVVDEPTSMAYVTHGRLGEWGVTEDQVFATARQNLVEGSGHVEGPPSDGGPVLLRFIDTGDAYTTSMLLIDGFLSGLANRVGGRPVAFMPHKDTLIVTSDAPAALRAIYGLVEQEFREATRSLSPAGYTVDDAGAVIPYQAPPGSELAPVVHRAEVILAAAEYGGQKEALDAQHERDELDIYVDSLLVVQRPDDSLFSVAVWGDGVDTLMPEADFVAFQPGDGPGEALTVPFDIVVREASLLPEPGYTPVRYRVTAWPREPVMQRLRAQAVTP